MVLNPHARSWCPDPQNSSSPPDQAFAGGNLPIQFLPCHIYNASATPNPTPTMVPFCLPNLFLYEASAASPVACPAYFYYQYPGFQLYHQAVVAIDVLDVVGCENDGMKKKLLDSSEELKGLLGISNVYEPPKKARRFVPPRLKRGYFEGFLRKRPPAKKFVPLAFHEKKDFQFCNYTTLMIKNIPNKYRRNSFMEFLDKCCSEHQLKYDFLYLPMDFKSGDNLGYAFVNFTSTSAAKKIKQVFDGYKWGGYQTSYGTYTSKKISETAWAKIQGKDALVRHFERSSFLCNNPEYLPVVISPPRDGSISAIPLATVGELRGCCNSKN